MKTFIILTISIISILVVFIGLSSDIAGLTGYNVVDTIKDNAPSSYIILVLLIAIFYLITYIKEIKKRTVNNQNALNVDPIPEEKVLSASDEAILDKLFNVFSGSILHNFFEGLAETRSVFIGQAANFEEELKLFLSPHNRLRNKQLEDAKVQFLSDFQNFLSFTTQFDTYNGSVTARFKAKTDEEEEIYLGMVRKLYKEWANFLEIVEKEAPNYQIKD
ncbi:hypothetical protein [Bacillus mycoides]|uniref:Uncharacterized protein n=1 Tax=Bacillus mycoides TaxID=1405 RepID=A0A4U3A491_BACMY|nr:hypothetical protein [Bacillus mycoides]TKI82198.1 hypothetical protein FC701_22335 [Bacillus mycoides]